MTQGILENMSKTPGILCVRTIKSKLNGIQSSTSKCLFITSWTGRVGLGGMQWGRVGKGLGRVRVE